MQVFVRRFDAAKDNTRGLQLPWHYDSSQLTAVAVLDVPGFDASTSSGGDLIVDVANSTSATGQGKGTIEQLKAAKEVLCVLQAGDVALLDSTCRHRVSPTTSGSRWTVCVFFGFA